MTFQTNSRAVVITGKTKIRITASRSWSQLTDAAALKDRLAVLGP